ncbi:unnamed protein product [Coregonus sp. 'balchen']|nr:unnamed protein product [Coregonus sp. 'balchen']
MVSNQKQLSIVVSDWGSYLGSRLTTLVCGILFLCSGFVACSTFTFVFISLFCRCSLNKLICSPTTLHLGPIRHPRA